MKSKATITGGKRGFRRALHASLESRMINPTIRYSRARGFHAESGIHPADPDVLWGCPVELRNGWTRIKISPSPGQYPEIRQIILETEREAQIEK